MSLGEFRRGASQLARNPLGILALFLLLVYGIAALVLGVAGHRVEPSERQALILFLVGFPVLVLLAFYRLVTQHHAKLYAPSDYDDERLFLRSLTPTEQMQRMAQEMEGAAADPAPESDGPSEEIDGGARAVPKHADLLLAKELALRQLEREIGRRLTRDVALASGRGDLVLDGVADSGSDLVTAQVVILPSPATRFHEAPVVIQRVIDVMHVIHRSRPLVAVRPYLLVVFRSLDGYVRAEVEARYREFELVDGLQVRIYELAALAGPSLHARIREVARDLEGLA